MSTLFDRAYSQPIESLKSNFSILMVAQNVLIIFVFYFFIILLHVLIPGTHVEGYCCDSNFKPLNYKLNGLRTLLVTVFIFLLLPQNLQTYFYVNNFYLAIGANIVGLSLSIFLYFRGGHEIYNRCVTVDQLQIDKSKLAKNEEQFNALQRIYIGWEWNPRFFGIDAKMQLYVIGAIGLAINVLSCCSYHFYKTERGISNGLLIYTFLMSWFLCEYMFFEHIHLYTYDLFAEKLGFKLTWGCQVFYPFFYCIGIYSISSDSKINDLTLIQCVLTLIVFFSGWLMTRGSNLQKFYFRIYPNQKTIFFGLIEQKTIPGTRILISGFWGIARHLNYFGEILQSVALCIPGLIMGDNMFYKLIPFGYPLYYFILFIKRQLDDDELCEKKYGKKWIEYCKIVQWRIFPGIW
eukprot:gene12593-6413_t